MRPLFFPARIWHLRINGELIPITGNHPVYVRGRGFVAVSLLKPGDELRSFTGVPAVVTSVEETDEIKPVYNVRVADFRTYFVGTLERRLAVLVHNQSAAAPGRAAPAERPAPPTRAPQPVRQAPRPGASGPGQGPSPGAGTGAGPAGGVNTISVPRNEMHKYEGSQPMGFPSYEAWEKARNAYLEDRAKYGKPLSHEPTGGEVLGWMADQVKKVTNYNERLDKAKKLARASGMSQAQIDEVLNRKYVSAPGKGADPADELLNAAKRRAAETQAGESTRGPKPTPAADHPSRAELMGGGKKPPTGGGSAVATGGEDPEEQKTFRDILTPEEQARFEELRKKHPDWMPAEGLDAPATVRTVEENAAARAQFTGRGHHRQPLKFGGEPNPADIVPTGETRTTKNPTHTEITNFWNSVLRRINSGKAQ